MTLDDGKRRDHGFDRGEADRQRRWREKVRFTTDGSYAYRPRTILIREREFDKTLAVLKRSSKRFPIELEGLRDDPSRFEDHGDWSAIKWEVESFEAPDLVAWLRGKEVSSAQVDHLFFANGISPAGTIIFPR